MSTSNSGAVTPRHRNVLLQATSEKIAEGEWSASFAIYTDDRDKSLIYWMPSLFRAFASEREAEQAAFSAGLEFIERLD